MKTIVLFFGRATPPHLGHGVAFKKVLDAVKFVDRLEFSTLNFSPEIIKGWN